MFMYKLTLFVYILLFYAFYEYMTMRYYYNLSQALLLFERLSIDYNDIYTILCEKAVYIDPDTTNKTKNIILNNLDYCPNDPFFNKESNYDYFSNDRLCVIFLNTTKNAFTDMIFNYC